MENECVVGSEHKWEYYVADKWTSQATGDTFGVPYYFCRLCKKTWCNGRLGYIRP